MRLCSYTEGGTEHLGWVEAGRVAPVAGAAGDHLPATMADLVAGGADALARLRAAGPELAATGGRPVDELELLAPLPRPGKVVAVGLNYLGHATEQQQQAPSEPLVFAKLPSAVVGHGAEIVWDPALARQVDAEAELAVVIGRRARHVSVADALDYVLGYTACNDVSARDLQAADGQWVRAKSLDTFCPMGPVLVTADELPDPSGLRIECRVNGTSMQSASTADMHFSVGQLISWCSASFTLEPGDVIATGTPPGVGVFRDPPVFLQPGDRVRCEIEGIGLVENPIVDWADAEGD
jgi:2-keto-4-pentenoate hydratase/2-oxohepta-3-ene-1,7-dioic acid hydratase in catechol pathway